MIGNTTPSTKHWLFVTGVPSNTPLQEVRDYFGQFGALDRVEFSPTTTKSTALIIGPSSARTSWLILGQKDGLEFRGRQLQVQRFMAGSRLAAKVGDMNRRRALARKIPGGLALSWLTGWLETFFGPVETVYPFASDNAQMRDFDDHRKVKSYSILFRDRSSTKKLLELGSFWFYPGAEASLFERFKPNKRQDGHLTGHPAGRAERGAGGTELRRPHHPLSCFPDPNNHPDLHQLRLTKNSSAESDIDPRLHAAKPTSVCYSLHELRSLNSRPENIKFNRNIKI